jgi:type II secretory pathway pseudopilin PulG
MSPATLPTSSARPGSATLRGFGLLELVVALIVVALVASVGVSTYVAHVNRTHDAIAEHELIGMFREASAIAKVEGSGRIRYSTEVFDRTTVRGPDRAAGGVFAQDSGSSWHSGGDHLAVVQVDQNHLELLPAGVSSEAHGWVSLGLTADETGVGLAMRSRSGNCVRLTGVDGNLTRTWVEAAAVGDCVAAGPGISVPGDARFPITATGGLNQITVGWAHQAGATAYQVACWHALRPPITVDVTVDAATAADDPLNAVVGGLENHIVHTCQVVAATPGGDLASDEAQATPRGPLFCPWPPYGLLEDTEESLQACRDLWDPNADPWPIGPWLPPVPSAIPGSPPLRTVHEPPRLPNETATPADGKNRPWSLTSFPSSHPNPPHRLYLTMRGTGAVLRIVDNGHASSSTVAFGAGTFDQPTGILAGPNPRRSYQTPSVTFDTVFVAEHGTGKIWWFDPDLHTRYELASGFDRPTDLAGWACFDGTGNRVAGVCLYVSDADGVWSLNLNTGSRTLLVAGSFDGLITASSANTATLWASDGSGTRRFTTTGAPLGPIGGVTAGAGGQQMTASTVYVADRGSGAVHVVHPDGAVTRTYTGFTEPSDVHFHGQAGVMYVVDADCVHTINTITHDITPLWCGPPTWAHTLDFNDGQLPTVHGWTQSGNNNHNNVTVEVVDGWLRIDDRDTTDNNGRRFFRRVDVVTTDFTVQAEVRVTGPTWDINVTNHHEETNIEGPAGQVLQVAGDGRTAGIHIQPGAITDGTNSWTVDTTNNPVVVRITKRGTNFTLFVNGHRAFNLATQASSANHVIFGTKALSNTQPFSTQDRSAAEWNTVQYVAADLGGSEMPFADRAVWENVYDFTSGTEELRSQGFWLVRRNQNTAVSTVDGGVLTVDDPGGVWKREHAFGVGDTYTLQFTARADNTVRPTQPVTAYLQDRTHRWEIRFTSAGVWDAHNPAKVHQLFADGGHRSTFRLAKTQTTVWLFVDNEPAFQVTPVTATHPTRSAFIGARGGAQPFWQLSDLRVSGRYLHPDIVPMPTAPDHTWRQTWDFTDGRRLHQAGWTRTGVDRFDTVVDGRLVVNDNHWDDAVHWQRHNVVSEQFTVDVAIEVNDGINNNGNLPYTRLIVDAGHGNNRFEVGFGSWAVTDRVANVSRPMVLAGPSQVRVVRNGATAQLWVNGTFVADLAAGATGGGGNRVLLGSNNRDSGRQWYAVDHIRFTNKAVTTGWDVNSGDGWFTVNFDNGLLPQTKAFTQVGTLGTYQVSDGRLVITDNRAGTNPADRVGFVAGGAVGTNFTLDARVAVSSGTASSDRLGIGLAAGGVGWFAAVGPFAVLDHYSGVVYPVNDSGPKGPQVRLVKAGTTVQLWINGLYRGNLTQGNPGVMGHNGAFFGSLDGWDTGVFAFDDIRLASQAHTGDWQTTTPSGWWGARNFDDGLDPTLVGFRAEGSTALWSVADGKLRLDDNRTDARIALLGRRALTPGGDFTFEAKVAVSHVNGRPLMVAVADGSQLFAVRVHPGSITDRHNPARSVTVSPGTENTIRIVKDNTVAYLYVNGVERFELTAGAIVDVWGSNYMWVGYEFGGDTATVNQARFNATVDDVRWARNPLTPSTHP